MKLFRSRPSKDRREKFWIPPVARLPEPSAARTAAEMPKKPAYAYRLPESLAKTPGQVIAAE